MIYDKNGNELHIGDIIVGTTPRQYPITNEEGKYKIIRVCEGTYENIEVEVIDHNNTSYIGGTYWVDSEHFIKVENDTNNDTNNTNNNTKRVCEYCGKKKLNCLELNSKYYCKKCYDFINKQVRHSYHSYSPIIQYRELNNNDNEKYKNVVMGMEWETEPKGYDYNINEIIKDTLMIFNTPSEELCYSSSDGSLNQNGSEFVFQPMDKNYIYSIEDKLTSACDYLKEHSWQSHDGGNCGMHIHVNREAFGNSEEEIEKNINKLILFTEFYKEELIKFSRRANNRLGYCTPLTDYCRSRFNGKYEKYKKFNLKYLGKVKNDYRREHSLLINLQHSNTIEIRVFRGTLNPKTIIATFEFVNNLIRVIRENSTSNIYWNKVINYGETKYLKDYVEEREIKPNGRHLKDYANEFDSIIEKIKIDNKLLKEELTQTLKDISEELSSLINVEIPNDRNRTQLSDIIDKLNNLYNLWGYLNRGIRTSDFYSISSLLTTLSRDTQYEEKVKETNDKVDEYIENERELNNLEY